MKKSAMLLSGFLMAGVVSFAQKVQKDSLKTIQLQGISITSTRAADKTPMVFMNMGKEEIGKQNFGLDLPFLISLTPSVVTTTDAGAGVGYTTMRLRGTDASRINVTVNSIPMNDAESHSIYWVNTPDFASSLEDLQIQRGVGTSTNGAGSFGGSVNMQTLRPAFKSYAEVNGSYGSFNTQKETVKVGTGLLNNRWAFDTRISNIQSDGYRDRASADLKSYFAQAGYYGDNTIVKLVTFGGKEKTYHAWDGIDRETLKNDRTYNPNGEIKENGKVVGFYDDQNDNYTQTHYQLLFNQILTEELDLDVALHYTRGDGFYEEYKNKRTLEEYALLPFMDAAGNQVKKSDLVRRKNVASDFGGAVFSLNYENQRLKASLGGAVNKYVNDHDGKVMWIKSYIGNWSPDNTYYTNRGEKKDANIYAKANYELLKGVTLYGDLQYRSIRYTIDGVNDKWDWTSTPNGMQSLDIDETFHFFNPKAGLSWQINKNHVVYGSFAVAHKEPTRNNYTDGLFAQLPEAESLLDYELGYTFRNERFSAGVNLYYMDYDNQLILNGQMNEIGEPVAENVKSSYRMGIELMAGVQILPLLRWDLNATFSRNRIKDYTEYLSDVDENWESLYTEEWGISQTERYIGNTDIAFSPNVIANSIFSFNYKGFDASLQSQYVSKQYLNNASQEDCVLNEYFVNNLNVGYSFQLPSTKKLHLGVTVYNLFDELYESNGYASGSAVYDSKDGQKHANSKLLYVSNYAAYYPNAGLNFLAHLTLSF